VKNINSNTTLEGLDLSSIKKILSAGASGSVILRAFGNLLRFFLAVTLARMLGPEIFGMYSYAIAIVALVSIIGILGMDQIPSRFLGDYLENKEWGLVKGLVNSSQQMVLIASILITLVAGLFIYIYPRNLSDTEVLSILIILGSVPLVALSQTRQALCRGMHHPILAQIPENIIYPSLIIILIFFYRHIYPVSDLNLITVSLINIFSWAAVWLIGLALLRISIPSLVKLANPKNERRRWISMTPAIILSTGSYIILSKSDIIILQALATSKDMGIYVAAARGSELIQFMYEAVTLAGVSIFSSLYAINNQEKITAFISLVSRYIFFGTLPVYVFFIYSAEWLLGFFGPEYVEGYQVFYILTTSYFISSIGGIVIPMMYVIGRQKEAAFIILVYALINIILSLVLVNYFGAVGAAWSFGASLIFMKATFMFRLYKIKGYICLPFLFRTNNS
jgi:O-antigen/teichoic acid export membrane protein